LQQKYSSYRILLKQELKDFMKKALVILVLGTLISACARDSAYRMSEYEKKAQRGYHANEAQRLLDSNEKNKKANQKAADKYREEQNKQLNSINNRNNKKYTSSNNRTFKFY
jgi:hypothetical protein